MLCAVHSQENIDGGGASPQPVSHLAVGLFKKCTITTLPYSLTTKRSTKISSQDFIKWFGLNSFLFSQKVRASHKLNFNLILTAQENI